ncbi:MAG: hypothetical protein R2800_06320 [Flavipsychrobacter sp.]
MRVNPRIIFTLLIVLVLGISNNTIAQNLGVYPTTLDFNLSAGQGEAQVINISNGSSQKVQFRTYLNDWIRDSVGGHAYYEPNTIDRSCASWITLDKNFIELEPGESTQLTVQLRAPGDDTKPKMRWAMIFIETVQEQTKTDDNNAQAAVRNLLRVGVHVYQTPPNVSEKGIEVIDIKPVADIPNVYNLSCKNTGDIMLECKAYLEFTSMSDGEQTKLDNVEFPMFPGQKRLVTFELPKNMPEGKYNVLGVLDAGEDIPLEAVESTIEVKKPQDQK